MNEINELDELIRQGDALRDAKKFDEAMACYRQVIERAPHAPEGHYKLGTVHARACRNAEAEQCYRQALALRRGYPEALNNLALVYSSMARFGEGETLYREILSNEIDHFEAHINLGNLLADTGRGLESLYHYRRALALRPDSSLANERVGGSLRAHEQVLAAMPYLRLALELDPRSHVTWNLLGACHFVRGEHEEADHAFAESLALEADQAAAWNNRLMLSNLMTIDRAEAFERHRAFGALKRRQAGPPGDNRRAIDPARRLRVGFVSGDLRHHSVAYFLLSFLPHLDRQQVETWAYSNCRTKDDVTQALKPLFQHWTDIIDLLDDAAVEAVRRDRIDILIDLGGHTNLNRLGVFMHKPAPIQLTWIGYPGSTGLDCVDYRLTDAVADPDDEDQRFHTETLWRLPGPFLCFSPPAVAPDVAPPPSASGGPITFGSFNARVKLGDECAALWARVLAALPDARLVVKSVSGIQEAEAKEQLVEQFVRHGVAADRIQVLSGLPATADHLAQYGLIDIALDAFPYHGTTTTCEALWMGVPVVTLAGDRHVSRVGCSLLTHVGLPELIAHSPEEFVAIACELARSPERLRRYRSMLREQMRQSPLLDGASMADRFSVATREMWRRYCASHSDAALAQGVASDDVEPRLRLNIGGRQPRAGWKILAAKGGDGVDYVGDITSLEMLGDESCEEIYCAHVLQRLPVKDIVGALASLYRILVAGGRLYVAVPDMDTLTALFQRADLDATRRFQVMRMMFGGQVDGGDFHLAGLNLEFLVGFLAQAGFTSVEQVESFHLFNDDSETMIDDVRVSLNLVVEK